MSELEKLDAYLSSDDAPQNSMLLSDLDGFMAGILCSPKLIMPSEWFPVAMGLKKDNFTDVGQATWVTESIMSRYNGVAQMLNSVPSYIEPIFWQSPEGFPIAMDWCEGFMQALHLRTDDWASLLETDNGNALLFPILAHLIDEDGNSLVGAQQEELDALLDSSAEKIPEVVPQIFQFWQSRREVSN